MAQDAPFDLIGRPGKGALGFDPSAVFSGFGAPRDAVPADQPQPDAENAEVENGSD